MVFDIEYRMTPISIFHMTPPISFWRHYTLSIGSDKSTRLKGGGLNPSRDLLIVDATCVPEDTYYPSD